MSKRAVILAGGKGIRLRPYTVQVPKPLMPLGDCPILELIIRQLALQGFSHITLAVNHQAEVIRSFFGNGARWGLQIDYSCEHAPLGTLGPLTLIEDLPEHFLVMNADILTDLPYAALWERHLQGSQRLTLAACYREQVSEFGVLEADAEGRLLHFREKPRQRLCVNMGVYMMQRELLAQVPLGQPYDVDALLRTLLVQGEAPQLFLHPGYWLDIGCPEDYQRASQEFAEMKGRFLYAVSEVGSHSLSGEGRRGNRNGKRG